MGRRSSIVPGSDKSGTKSTLKKKSDAGSPDSGKKGKPRKVPVENANSNVSNFMAKQRFMIWNSTYAKLRISFKILPGNNKDSNNVQTKPRVMQTYCVRKRVKETIPKGQTYVVARNITDDNVPAELWVPYKRVNLNANWYIIPHSILGDVEEYKVAAAGAVQTSGLTDTQKHIQRNIPVTTMRIDSTFPIDSTERHAKPMHPFVSWTEASSKERKTDIKGVELKRGIPCDNPYQNDIQEADIITGSTNSTGISVNRTPGEVRPPSSIRSTSRPTSSTKLTTRPSSSITSTSSPTSTIKSLLRHKSPMTSNSIKSLSRSYYSTNSRPSSSRPTSSIPSTSRPTSSIKSISRPSNSSQWTSRPSSYAKSTLTQWTSDPLVAQEKSLKSSSTTEDSFNELLVSQVHGPALKVAGHTVLWCHGDTGLDHKLGVAVYRGQPGIINLTIENIGTCVMKYRLIKIPKDGTLNSGVPHAYDKIYVDDSEGLMLPKDKHIISAIFWSKITGIYSERWRLDTKPKLGGRNGIILTFWGIAEEPVGEKNDITYVEQLLEDKIKSALVKDITNELFENACIEQKPKNYMNIDYPEEFKQWFSPELGTPDVFSVCNPGLTYQSGHVTEIVKIAEVVSPETTYNKWILPITKIRTAIIEMPVDRVKCHKENITSDHLSKLFASHVQELSFVKTVPVVSQKEVFCKGLLLKVVNSISDQACRIKKIHGIALDIDVILGNEHKDALKSPRRGSKIPSLKPKKKMIPARFSDIVRGISTAKKQIYKSRVRPVIYMKYLEKFRLSTYATLREMVDNLESILSDV